MHEMLNAMGDATRFAIVERLLKEGELPAGEIAKRFDMSKPAISRHLKVLEDAGLIERQIRAQFRFFRINPKNFATMNHWFEEHRQFWEASFDRLENLLREEKH